MASFLCTLAIALVGLIAGAVACPAGTTVIGPTIGGMCPAGATAECGCCCGTATFFSAKMQSTLQRTYVECIDKDSNCMYNIGRCTLAAYQDTMKTNCARTCGFCDNNPAAAMPLKQQPTVCTDRSNDCSYNYYYCNAAYYKELMAYQCAYTCNKCGCTDMRYDCANQAAYCDFVKYPTYKTYMTNNCPRTCGICTPAQQTQAAVPAPAPAPAVSCVDLTTDCVGNSNYCTVESYKQLMKDQCPKTCGYC